MGYKHVANGTITSPAGFLAGATFADLKAWGERPFDLAILSCEMPCAAAGVFTTNRVKAAPVVLCRNRLKNESARGLIVNSGCANAVIGEQGFADAETMATLAANRLNISPSEVMVASTGVIGTRLPMDRIETGTSRIELSKSGGHDLARAIMTTDTFPKEIAISLMIDGTKVTIGGVAKGAGMIHPDMATMLCFLTTDAAVEPDFLQATLKKAVESSFNMISVDGDTSTNDTVLIFASGLAGNAILNGAFPEAKVFEDALSEVCVHLAKSIARDGEGATKLIEVNVEGAYSAGDAGLIARTIAASSLVKTAVYGCDPNWGRVIAAAGRAGVDVIESKMDLYLEQMCLVKGGVALPFDAREAEAIMGKDEVVFRLCLNLGDGRAISWGCDLTEKYIELNGDYTT